MEKRWIWPFELVEKIGEGGMGVVYRARYVKNNTFVAVKLLPTDTSDETFFVRFEREMEILKGLRHPNIVRCFGGVSRDSQRFYAMELVGGGTLAQLIRRQRQLPWESVVKYGQQMCAALQYAHHRNIIHRDIKPGNFLVTDKGTLKLSDFGLATIVDSSRLTAAGRTMGTFRYMAPEQIRGTPPVSRRTDLYALGCVLYEMLVGHAPYLGDNPAEVLHQHLKSPVPRASAIALDCPPDLEKLVTQLLEKSADARPASAAVVAERLAGVTQTTRYVPTPSVQPQWSSSHESPTVQDPTTVSRRALRGGVASLIIAAMVMALWSVHLVRTNRAGAEATELWVEHLDHREASVRIAAAHALGKLVDQSDDALEALASHLNDTHPDVRHAVVKAIGDAGSSARPVMDQLNEVRVKDSDHRVRSEARLAAKRIRSDFGHSRGWFVPTTITVIGFLLLAVARWRRWSLCWGGPSGDPLASEPPRPAEPDAAEAISETADAPLLHTDIRSAS